MNADKLENFLADSLLESLVSLEETSFLLEEILSASGVDLNFNLEERSNGH